MYIYNIYIYIYIYIYMYICILYREIKSANIDKIKASVI